MTRDMWHMVGGEHSVKISSPQLLWFGIDSTLNIFPQTMTESVNESVNDGGDWRTAPASPGLLNMCLKLFTSYCLIRASTFQGIALILWLCWMLAFFFSDLNCLFENVHGSQSAVTMSTMKQLWWAMRDIFCTCILYFFWVKYIWIFDVQFEPIYYQV